MNLRDGGGGGDKNEYYTPRSFFCPLFTNIGLLFSLYHGLLGFIFGMSIHAGSVYLVFAIYVW